MWQQATQFNGNWIVQEGQFYNHWFKFKWDSLMCTWQWFRSREQVSLCFIDYNSYIIHTFFPRHLCITIKSSASTGNDDKSTDELNRLLVENSDLSKHNVSNVLSSANLYTHLPSEHSSHQKFVCCGSCRQWLQVLLFVPLSLVDLLHDHQICAMLGRFYAGSCSFWICLLSKMWFMQWLFNGLIK